MKGIKGRCVILKPLYIPWWGGVERKRDKERKKKGNKYVYILPRSTRRISFLLIIDDNDDELAAFAGAGAF